MNSCEEIIQNLLHKKPAKGCSSMARDHGLCGGGAHGSWIGSTAEWFGQQLWKGSFGKGRWEEGLETTGGQRGRQCLTRESKQNGVTSAITVLSFRIESPSEFPFLHLDM